MPRLADAIALFASNEPIFLLRAGVVPGGSLVAPPASATGRPVVGVDAASIGDARAVEAPDQFDKQIYEMREPPACLYLEAPRGLSEAASFGEWARAQRARVVPLSGRFSADPNPRVALIVTTLHRGGAERVVLSLHAGLSARGITPLLATLDRPRRAFYDAPADTLCLAELAPTRPARLEALAKLLARAGVDLVHAHLLAGHETRALEATGVPVVVTLHNARAGWQSGQADLRAGDVSLVVPCSRSADHEAQAVGLDVPRRVIWNGIDPRTTQPSSGASSAADARRALGLSATRAGLTLLALANPRPQKRLERLPAIVAELVRRGHDAVLLVVGETVASDAASATSIAALEAAIVAAEVSARIVRTGPRRGLGEVFAASDVLVSTSDHEGLSLAQLEAVAAGLPLVLTEVGGADDLASFHPDRVALVAPTADASVFAAAIEAVVAKRGLASPNDAQPKLARPFTESAMIDRHASLYRRVLAGRAPRLTDLVIVMNNLVVGGAQTSARRLALTLSAPPAEKRHGSSVSVIVVEEDPALPSPGRSALLAAGVEVFATPSARRFPADEIAQAALAKIEALAPRAVFFWNLRPGLRLRLADALVGVRVVDVSPGAMSFDSLESLFVKRADRMLEVYRTSRDYGARLAGAIVKYADERERAERLLGIAVSVIPNGVPWPARPRRRTLVGGPIVIGTATRLSPDKQLETLVEAVRLLWARRDDIRVLVAGGDDPGHEAYATSLRASALGLPIDFVGDRPSIEAFHDELDVFALIAEPAGCPNASLEAMAAGLPVVITDAGGAREQIDDERTGLVVGRKDVAGLARALERLVDDAALRGRLGDAARAEARARFSLATMAEAYRGLIG